MAGKPPTLTSEAVNALDEAVAAKDNLSRAEAALAAAVVKAKLAGASWPQIGAALGTSHQAAQQRFGPHVPS